VGRHLILPLCPKNKNPIKFLCKFCMISCRMGGYCLLGGKKYQFSTTNALRLRRKSFHTANRFGKRSVLKAEEIKNERTTS
jgi:hypothetical protein